MEGHNSSIASSLEGNAAYFHPWRDKSVSENNSVLRRGTDSSDPQNAGAVPRALETYCTAYSRFNLMGVSMFRMIGLLAFLIASPAIAQQSQAARETSSASPDRNQQTIIQPELKTLLLPYSQADSGLTPDDEKRFDEFTRAYLASGGGAISVTVPSGPDANNALAYFGERLASEGVARSHIMVGTRADNDSRVELWYAGFTAPVAVADNAAVESIKAGHHDCPHCNLAGANLDNTCVKGGNLEGADFSNVHGVLMCMSYANFTNVSFRHADLAGANMAHAIVDGADFSGADLSITSFKGTDMSKAKGLTQAQMNQSCGDKDTTPPLGLTVHTCT